MNDQTKHRIVGIVVIAAFLVILIPALMKHENPEVKKTHHASNERPVTAMVEPVSSASVEAEMYQTTQVAQVSLDQAPVNKESTQPLAESKDSIESLDSSMVDTASEAPAASSSPTPPTPKPAAVQATVESEKPVVLPPPPPMPVVQEKPKPVVLSKQKTAEKKIVSAPMPIQSKPVAKNTAKLTLICFQLGTFSNPNNASLLVKKLKVKGFLTAKMTMVSLPNGKKVEKVSYCKAMAPGEISTVRTKLALIAGTSPFITR